MRYHVSSAFRAPIDTGTNDVRMGGRFADVDVDHVAGMVEKFMDSLAVEVSVFDTETRCYVFTALKEQ